MISCSGYDLFEYKLQSIFRIELLYCGMKLILIEDERELASTIISYLEGEDYSIDNTYSYSKAEEMIHLTEYDIALVDIMLPDGNGLVLLEKLKKINPQCGVLIISARDTLDDKITGLGIGADDYITKPFHLAELNARIKSVIRRKHYYGSNEIIFGDLKIDIDKREIFVNNNLIDLTRREYDLLLFFVSNKERVLSKETIFEHVWGDDSNLFDELDFLYTHIKNLRKKITEHSSKNYIHSVYGIGYKFGEHETN